jgi:hypothetical protein
LTINKMPGYGWVRRRARRVKKNGVNVTPTIAHRTLPPRSTLFATSVSKSTANAATPPTTAPTAPHRPSIFGNHVRGIVDLSAPAFDRTTLESLISTFITAQAIEAVAALDREAAIAILEANHNLLAKELREASDYSGGQYFSNFVSILDSIEAGLLDRLLTGLDLATAAPHWLKRLHDGGDGAVVVRVLLVIVGSWLHVRHWARVVPARRDPPRNHFGKVCWPS